GGDAFFVGDEAEITFTVEAANVENDTYLYDEANNSIGKMHDDGLDGDVAANDGTLTYVLKTVAKEESSVHYFAKTEDATSNQVLVRADAGRRLRCLHLLTKPRRRQVTLNAVKSFGPNQVILWDGHGGYESDIHSFLLTGEKFDWWKWATKQSYREDNAQNVTIYCDDQVCITSKFIDTYCGDLSGDLVYLGACESEKDSTLADAFLNKGATHET
ncbi:MAG: hypothetical protein Q4B54_11115, partial [Coriobacteriales bacterium]|nr:hypothetical protein [Coriobacteriales bacterium]